MCLLFFDANRYGSIFTKKAIKSPELADTWLASWRDVDGCVRHDLLYKAATNNQAEYGAMLFALNHVFHHAQIQLMTGDRWLEEATIYGDSQLVIYQLNGQYKVENEDLRPLWLEAINLVHILAKQLNVTVKFAWVPREINNQALGLEKKISDSNISGAINETDNTK